MRRAGTPSRDRRLLRSLLLIRDTDLKDFEYELLTAFIENVVFRIDKGFQPALYIVLGRAVEAIFEEYPKLNRIISRSAGCLARTP